MASAPAPTLTPWQQKGYDAPPVGVSLAGAIVCAIVFFLAGLVCMGYVRRSKYRPATGMFIACVFRGVSLSLRAASIGAGGINIGAAIMYGFLQGAGFGIAIAIQIISCAGWFKNTMPSANLPPNGRIWYIITLCLFPIVIVFGPIIGLAGALVANLNPTIDNLNTASQLRQAAAGGMLGVVSIALIIASVATLVAASKAGLRRPSGKLAPHAAMLFALPSLVFLTWSAAYRLASYTTHTELQTNEKDFYCLQMLPEMLQAILYVAGPTTRIHLSSNFAQWWRDIGSAGFQANGKPAPPPPQSWLFDDSAEQTLELQRSQPEPVAVVIKG